MSRGKGKSAVAAAAYRSGEKLTNEWDGMTHDYTRKGGVVHTEIMLPPHAPPSFSDRSTLWNSVELYEKAGNAQLAREIDAALPIELSREEQIRLVREYCSSQFVSRGMSQKYSEEYYALKAELAELQEQLSAFENAGGRAQKFLKLTERYAAFTDLTPAILNEFISRIEVHERDKKRAKQAIQHIGIYFNYIGKFENEVTQLTEPTEQEIRQMREKIEEAQKEKSRAYHRQYSREYRARNLEKQREYERIKAREYRARRKAQTAAAQPAQ